MADPDENTGTDEPTGTNASPESEDADAGELDVVDELMHQVATLEQAVEGNVKWLGAMEARVEAVEQRVASQLQLGQDYNRLDAQVSGLQAAFDERGGPPTFGVPEAKDPAVEFGPVEGSLATLESGTGVVLNGQKFVVVGPAREATVKVRPWGGRGGAQYLPSSRVPDEVLSE